MEAKLTVDRAGRVLLPKALREELRLGPGDVIDLVSEGEEILLRPLKPKARLKKKKGIWVYQGEPTSASVVDIIDRVREGRSRDALGLR